MIGPVMLISTWMQQIIKRILVVITKRIEKESNYVNEFNYDFKHFEMFDVFNEMRLYVF